MFRHEIDELHTRKVSEYLADGYNLYTRTMCGHQGEVGRVDLMKGDDFIRIWGNGTHVEGAMRLDINIGRYKGKLRGWDQELVWNDQLEIVEKLTFYRISDTWFVTPEEYERIKAKRHDRILMNLRPSYTFPVEAARIVLPFVRRQPKCKSARVNEVQRVWKQVDNQGKASYFVRARCKEYRIA